MQRTVTPSGKPYIGSNPIPSTINKVYKIDSLNEFFSLPWILEYINKRIAKNIKSEVQTKHQGILPPTFHVSYFSFALRVLIVSKRLNCYYLRSWDRKTFWKIRIFFTESYAFHSPCARKAFFPTKEDRKKLSLVGQLNCRNKRKVSAYIKTQKNPW